MTKNKFSRFCYGVAANYFIYRSAVCISELASLILIEHFYISTSTVLATTSVQTRHQL